MKHTKVFQPLKPKTDRLTCAYIGQDGSALTYWERRTELGTQRYMQATTRIPNFYISTNGSPTHPDAMTPTGSLRRIVLHEPGIIAVPLAAAAGRRIHIDVWYNNSSENTKRLGFRVETLSIQIAGLGHYSVSHIVNVSSGGFDLQWMGSTGFDSDIPQQTAADLRKLYAEKRYDDTEKILRFEDHEKADQEAA